MSALPSEWKLHRLSELGFAYSGLSGKSKDDFGAGSNYVPYKNVFFNTFVDLDYVEQVYVAPDEAQNRVQKGDVLLTVSSETPEEVGMSAVVASEVTGDLYLNSFCFGFRPTVQGLLPRYLGYAFRSSYMRKKLVFLAQGSTRFNISKGRVLEIELPIPPMGEQQKIAAILTAVDDKLDVITRQIEATQTLKQGLMQTLFSRGVGTQDADGRWVPHAEFKESELGEIPAGWAVERIDAIASINPTRTKIDDESLDVTFLGMADISEDGKLIRQHTKTYAEVSKGFTSFVDNDVLVAKITPCFENGKGALVDGLANGIGFGSTEFHVIRADTKILDVRFIHAHTRTRKFRLLGERNMVGSAGQKRVPTGFIKSFLIAVPSLGEQQKIADILDAVDAKAENLIAKHTHYQTLKRGLMQKLLTGEWRVNVGASTSGS